MKLKVVTLLFASTFAFRGHAQQKQADTVIVPLAETSKIIFTVGDPADLEVLRHYNYQRLFEDIIDKLDGKVENHDDPDAAPTVGNDQAPAPEAENADDYDIESQDKDRWSRQDEEEEDDDDDDHHDRKWSKSRHGRIGQTWQSYNIDLGTNNYLDGDQFPDGSESYSVRPWGSWYVAANSVQRTRLGKNVFVEWGLGVSWYNFKFQQDNVLMQKDEFGVAFNLDQRDVDYIKSKLSATFINVSLLPVLDFNDNGRKPRVWDGDDGGFRFGVGPYVGYRIGSKSKLVYETDGDRKREKDRDSFYLNNLRYGLRFQLGIRSTDLFINYDMNDLFANDKGPKLNAVSFGIIL